MFNKIFINKSNLIHNLDFVRKFVKNKKICVMVKANAYGHGIRQIAKCLENEDICYGVSNESEALELRNYTSKQIIVFGAVENYYDLSKKQIDFAVFSVKEVMKICKFDKDKKVSSRMHLCLNTGMNRYGIKKENEFLKIIKILKHYKKQLSGLYTHFSSLTTDFNYTETQKRKFYRFCSLIPKEWNTVTHVGGGKTIFSGIEAQMYRSGLEIYGYGDNNLLPVMSIYSQVVDIVNVFKGEHIGYLSAFTAQKNMRVGAIPIGYGDGLPRKLSNNFSVEINGKKINNVGNICMDCFMVDLEKFNIKIGDKVLIMDNALNIAKLIDTTEYEVLTNFLKCRAERIVI